MALVGVVDVAGSKMDHCAIEFDGVHPAADSVPALEHQVGDTQLGECIGSADA